MAVSDCTDQDEIGCVFFLAPSGRDRLTVQVSDASGGAVLATVRLDLDADGGWDGAWHEICTETQRPIAVRPGAIVNIVIQQGECADGRASNPTSGTVLATFSR